jgi:hypothetical protein
MKTVDDLKKSKDVVSLDKLLKMIMDGKASFAPGYQVDSKGNVRLLEVSIVSKN